MKRNNRRASNLENSIIEDVAENFMNVYFNALNSNFFNSWKKRIWKTS